MKKRQIKAISKSGDKVRGKQKIKKIRARNT